MDEGAQLYGRYLEGDDDAFSELVDRYRDGLIFFINRTVRHLDTAEELAAECFAELIVHPDRYDTAAPFKTYLYAIGRHKAVSALRRRLRRRTVSLEDTSQKSVAYASFEDDMLRDEQHRKLHEALGQIHEDYRLVLHLVYFEDMSYDEAARVMHKTPKQIDNLAYRGRQALRRLLEKEEWL